jgi:hypothetical protein
MKYRVVIEIFRFFFLSLKYQSEAKCYTFLDFMLLYVREKNKKLALESDGLRCHLGISHRGIISIAYTCDVLLHH